MKSPSSTCHSPTVAPVAPVIAPTVAPVAPVIDPTIEFEGEDHDDHDEEHYEGDGHDHSEVHFGGDGHDHSEEHFEGDGHDHSEEHFEGDGHDYSELPSDYGTPPAGMMHMAVDYYDGKIYMGRLQRPHSRS